MKFFDESKEFEKIRRAYGSSSLLMAGIIASALGNFAAIGLCLVGHPWGMPMIGLAICLSAVTAGIEWHMALHARALNQLTASVIGMGLLVLIKTQL